jgi:PIN domain nuclease of toxin-antitoxin system
MTPTPKWKRSFTVRALSPSERPRFLLDSHVILWALAEPQRLSTQAKSAIVDRHNLVLISIASLWEISIKTALQKLEITTPLLDLWRTAERKLELKPLQISAEHVVAAAGLPNDHRDPFDRLLVAQAKIERATLITRDRQLASYGISILRA